MLHTLVLLRRGIFLHPFITTYHILLLDYNDEIPQYLRKLHMLLNQVRCIVLKFSYKMHNADGSFFFSIVGHPVIQLWSVCDALMGTRNFIRDCNRIIEMLKKWKYGENMDVLFVFPTKSRVLKLSWWNAIFFTFWESEFVQLEWYGSRCSVIFYVNF